ncbi:MAG: hypothetical protein EBV19_04330 [Flavobacteriia bacterium]|nr:hypothetical protein [Flavobacteriia bacterium]
MPVHHNITAPPLFNLLEKIKIRHGFIAKIPTFSIQKIKFQRIAISIDCHQGIFRDKLIR